MFNLISPDIQQMQDLLAVQVRLREAAQTNRAMAIKTLIDIAEASCVGPWDEEKRAGHYPEDWPPERIGEFVNRHLRETLRRAALANRPQSAEQCDRLARELADARQEIGRLHVQIQFAQRASNKAAEHELQASGGNRRLPAQGNNPRRAQSVPVDLPIARANTSQSEDVSPKQLNDFLLLMAATGLARADELDRRLAGGWGVEPASHEVKQAIATAIRRSLVEARVCVVDWANDKSGQFLLLTPAGSVRATEMGVEPVVSEYEIGRSRNWSPEHLYLVLTAADILPIEGYTDVDMTPGTVGSAAAGFCPDITARAGGRLVQIECPVSVQESRDINWNLVRQGGDSPICILAPNRKCMDAITSEIKASNGAGATIWASNVADYMAGQRGPSGSFWLHQR